MKKCIIVINGSGGVGKDSFVDFCRESAYVMNISTVDKVKQAAELLGWKGGKDELSRKFLSDLKLLAGAYSDHSYEYVKKNIDYFLKPSNHTTPQWSTPSNLYPEFELLFIHSREPEEIKRFVEDFECTTILIRNPFIDIITTNMADANVNNYEYDYVIYNDGSLFDLKVKAHQFIFDLGKEW